MDSNSILKNGTNSSKWNANRKSKFPKKIEKIPKMEKGRWGLLQANFRKCRLFYSNKFISLGII